MQPHTHAIEVMLPHLLSLISVDRAYAQYAIKRYFEIAPWAKDLIGEKLRQAWKGA